MNQGNNKLEELFEKAYEITKDKPENVTSAFAALLIKECAEHNDEMRKAGFIPTSYTLYKHFGLK